VKAKSMTQATKGALLLATLVASSASCQSTPRGNEAVEVVQAAATTVPVGPRPESITKAWGGKFYVSIQGPSGALGTFDGEVRQVDLETGVVTPFVSGLENPRGLAFTGQFLIAADQQKIYKIDEAGTVTLLAQASQFPFPAVFFNDAAAEPGGQTVLVSEMGRRDIIREVPPSPNAGHLIPPDSDGAWAVPATSRVYRITMDGQITSVFEPSRKLLVINGVTVAKKGKGVQNERLLVADFFYGNLVEVDTVTKHKEIITTAFRGADGIEQATDGTIFVSSFENGAVWRMDEDGENLKFLIDHVGFQTTADFYLDEAAHKLYVPNTPAGAIIILSTD
jgi:sugar lactone lactonase YvrE